jgi:hypothetical protein
LRDCLTRLVTSNSSNRQQLQLLSIVCPLPAEEPICQLPAGIRFLQLDALHYPPGKFPLVESVEPSETEIFENIHALALRLPEWHPSVTRFSK